MTINALRELLHAVPFKAFTIRLADGREVHGPHPDFITVTGGGRTAFVTNAIDENFSIVDLLLVTRLKSGDTVSPARPPTTLPQP